jgi:hypothetical protein
MEDKESTAAAPIDGCINKTLRTALSKGVSAKEDIEITSISYILQHNYAN